MVCATVCRCQQIPGATPLARKSADVPAILAPVRSRFEPRYTPAQREAVVAAILDDGLTAKDAVARAASPDGLYGLEPFTMPASTAANLAWRTERSQRPPV